MFASHALPISMLLDKAIVPISWSATVVALMLFRGLLAQPPEWTRWVPTVVLGALLAITLLPRLRGPLGLDPATSAEPRTSIALVLAAFAILAALVGGGVGSLAVLVLAFPIILISPWYGRERLAGWTLGAFAAALLLDMLLLGRTVSVADTAASMASLAAVLVIAVGSLNAAAATSARSAERTGRRLANDLPDSLRSGAVEHAAAASGNAAHAHDTAPEGANSFPAGSTVAASTANGGVQQGVSDEVESVAPYLEPELVDRRLKLGSRQWWRSGDQHRVVAEYLMDVRGSSGADEAVVWILDDGDSVLRPLAACSSNGWAERSNADDRWMALVRWSCEAAVTQCGVLHDGGGYVTAPLLLDGRLLGVLCLRSATPFREGEVQVKARATHHATCAARIVALLLAHKASSARSAALDQAMDAVRELQDHAPAEAPSSAICDAILQVCGCDASALVRWDADALTGIVEAGSGRFESVENAAVIVTSLVGRTCERGTPLRVASARDMLRRTRLFLLDESPGTIGAFAIQPMKRDGEVIGALVAAWHAPSDLAAHTASSMEVLASVGAHALYTSWRLERIQVAARTDSLTGLANRRYLDEQLQRVLAESSRYGDPAALILMDLDSFKAINDQHGHVVGDLVLQHAAATVRDGVRGVDLCARYGGEELAVLLPRTGLQGAVELAERLRASLESRPVHTVRGDIHVTASFGVASFPSDAPSAEALLALADKALYRAKEAGRNRVRAAQVKHYE